MEKVANGFADQQKQVQAISRDLIHHVDQLRRGGWVASSANQFYSKMDQDIFRSLQRLSAALGHSQIATQAIINLFRQSDEEASGVLRGEGGNGVGPAADGGSNVGMQAVGRSSISKSITEQSWYTLNNNQDGGWNGAPPGVAKAIVVNGIQNDVGDLRGLMQGASKEFGDIPVLGIYNATASKGLLGGIQDAGQTLADKIQAEFGIRPAPDNIAVNSLVEAIKATHGETPIVAHSQGGAITAAALRKLSDDGYDLSHVKVTTLGSAEFQFPKEVQVEHRVHANDVVPMLVGGRLDYYTFNPLTLGKQIITGEIKIFPTFNPLEAHSADNYFKNF
jgi:uncharacterized protein YukE